MKNILIMAVLLFFLFSALTYAGKLLSGKDIPAIPYICEYDNDMRLFYIDAATSKINNLILVGYDDKDFCSKIKLESLYRINYDDFLDHRQMERSFAMLKKIEPIDDNKGIRSKILHHKTNRYYGKINDNFGAIKLYLKVLNNFK